MLRRQRRDADLADGLLDFRRDIDAVLLLEPRRRTRRRPTVHAGGAADHQRADDRQPLLGEEETVPIGVDDGAEVGAVIRFATIVAPAFQQNHLSAGARQLASDRRAARTRTNDNYLGLCPHCFLQRRGCPWFIYLLLPGWRNFAPACGQFRPSAIRDAATGRSHRLLPARPPERSAGSSTNRMQSAGTSITAATALARPG